MRRLTVPAKTRVPSGWRTSGRSKRKASLSRFACSAGVLARCRTALRWGKRSKRMMTARCRWKISWKAFRGSSGAISSIARPHSSMHSCWSASASEWVSARQRKTRSTGLRRAPIPTRRPRLTRARQRASQAYISALSRYMLRRNWSSMTTRGDQQARVVEVERPMVVVSARRQRDVGAEAVPNLAVGGLDLADPQAQALLDARAQHPGEHLLGLVDLGGRDLEVLDLEEHAQLVLQALHLGGGEGVLIVDPREDHVQPLLDAVAGVGVDSRHALVGPAQAADESAGQLDHRLRLALRRCREGLVAGDAALDVGDGAHRRRARAGVDQAHLAEDVAWAEGAEGPDLAGLSDAHLHRTRDDDVGGVAGLALGDNPVPGGVLDSLHPIPRAGGFEHRPIRKGPYTCPIGETACGRGRLPAIRTVRAGTASRTAVAGAFGSFARLRRPRGSCCSRAPRRRPPGGRSPSGRSAAAARTARSPGPPASRAPVPPR